MLIRKSKIEDIPTIDAIYKQAKEYMRTHGNATQWQGDYPNYKDALSDIKNDVGYVCEDNGEIVAVFMFKEGNDKTYNTIVNGSWLNNKPYGVIHRIAVKYHGKGIADYCFQWCFERIRNIKIDTHQDNIAMQKALKRNGFVQCGTIYLENGESRIAFQKTKQNR